MILQRLKEYSEKIELPPPAYQKMKIKWLVKLDRDGNLLGLVKTEQESAKGKLIGIEHWVPNPGKKTVGIVSGLFSERADYVLGKFDDEQKEKRTAEKHLHYLANLDNFAMKKELPETHAIKAFFSKHNAELPSEFDQINAGDWIRFEINDVDPTDLTEVREYWADSLEDGKSGVCLLCGRERRLSRCQPVALKPIPGGQTSGVQLISANAAPFESFGLTQSYIAPLCRTCSEATHHTINHLISSENNSFRLGDKIVFIFWAMEDLPFSMKNLFSNPSEGDVKALFQSAFKGKGWVDIEETERFFCLGLSGSGGRAVVKEWIDTTLPTVRDNLRIFFDGHYLVEEKPYHSIYSLAAATARDLKDVPAHIPVALIRTALLGKPLPTAILTTTLRRCAIGYQSKDKRKHVLSSQAALIKLFLAYKSLELKEINLEEWMSKLDPSFDNPAYLYGRLFYLLERIQNAASGGGGVERTFGSAMTSPISALPRLVARAKQAHLPKLHRDSPGLYFWFQQQMTEVLDKLDPNVSFQTRLQPEEQGLFVLGYYHQRAQKKETVENEESTTQSNSNN